MRRRTFLVKSSRAALGSCLLPLTTRGAQSKSKMLVADLEAVIPKLMQESVVPGLSIALVDEGKLLCRRAFGIKDNATKALVDHETLFEAASVSKTVFAYAVMKLCEKGVLNLDAPLLKYGAKPLLEGDPRVEQITARHVLSHTSGFQDFRSRKEPLKIHFTPGEKFLYSGEGYYYLQSVVTHLTGHVDPKDCAKYECDLEVCGTDIDPLLETKLAATVRHEGQRLPLERHIGETFSQPARCGGKAFREEKAEATGCGALRVVRRIAHHCD